MVQNSKKQNNRNSTVNTDKTEKKHRLKISLKTGILCIVLILLVISPFILKGLLENHLINLLKKQVNGTAEVGSLHLGLSRAEVKNLRIIHTSGETWISAERIEIRYNLLKALESPTGQRAFISADIWRPSVILKYDKKGMLNLYSLFKEQPKKKPSPIMAEGAVRIHQGSFTFEDPRFYNFSRTAYPIDGRISLRGKEGIHLEQVNAAITETEGAGTITGYLPADLKGGVFRIKAHNIQGGPWVNYIINNKAFIIENALTDIDGVLSSPDFKRRDNLIESLELQAKIKLKDGRTRLSFLPDPVTDLTGEVTVTMDMVRLSEIKGRYGDTPITVNGRFFNFGNTSIALDIDAPRIYLEKMKKQPVVSMIPFKNSGCVSLKAGVDGLLSSPVVRGNVKFERIELKDEPVESGNADFTYYSGSVRWNLHGAKWRDGTFQGSGYVNVEDHPPHFLLGLKGQNADAGRFASFIFPDYPFRATSDFDISIVGTIDNPIIFGDSSFSNLRYENFTADRGKTHFIYSGKDILLSGTEASNGSGSISMPKGHIDFEHKFVNLDLFSFGIDLKSMSNSNLPVKSAIADVNAKVLGSFKSPLVFGTFANGNVKYKNSSFDNSHGSFYYGFTSNIFLANGITSLKDSTLQLFGSFILDKQPRGQLTFEAGNIKPSYLSDLVPGLENVSATKKINLKGFASGTADSLGWGFTGFGPLGNLLGIGKTSSGAEGTSGILSGRNVDFSQFIPSAARKSIKPGHGDGTILLAGGKGGTQAYFTLSAPNGRVLGLPLTTGRGALFLKGNRLSLQDIYLEGTASRKTGDSRMRLTQDLYRLSTYWGADTGSDRRTSLLARMYYAPYIYEGYTYTVDGWKINTLAAVPTGGSDPLKSPFSGIDGLPGIWKNQSLHQLKRTGSPGYPLNVEISATDGKTGGTERLVRVLDATITGIINTNDGRIDLNVESRSLNLGIAGRNIDLSPLGINLKDFHKFIALDSIEGDANFSGRMKGPWNSPVWEGSILVENGIISNEGFSLDSAFRAHSKGLNIKNFLLRQARSTYSGGGTVTLKPEPSFNLNLNTDGGKLSRILAFTPWKDLKATGLVYGALNVSGSPDRLKLDGDLSVRDGKVMNQPVSNLAMTFKSTADSICLENLQASIGNGSISGAGVMKAGALDFTFHAAQFPLEEIELLKSAFNKISGTGTMNLTLLGTVKNPEIALDLWGENILVKGHSFDRAGGSFLWEDGSLTLKNISLKSARQYWNMEGRVKFPGKSIPTTWKGWTARESRPGFDIQSQMQDFSIATILDLSNHPLAGKLEGSLAGTFAVSGSFPVPDFTADLRTIDGRIGKIPFKAIKASGELKGNRLRIGELSYKSDESSAFAAGSYDIGKNTVKFRADMDNMPVQLMGTFMPKARKIEGFVNGSLKIWGDPEYPDMEARITLDNGKFGSFPFDRAGGIIIADKGIMTFNNLSIEKDRHRIAFSGVVPVSYKNHALVNPSPVKITTVINEKNLDLLGLVVPFIQKTTGEIKGGMSITGIYPDLEITGGAQIKKGTVKMSILENEITDLNADVIFNGKELLIKTLTGAVGEGPFAVSGFARIDEKKVWVEELKFILTGENLNILMPGLIKGIVDTKVTLSGNQDRMTIGSLDPEKDDFFTVRKATVTLPGGRLKDLSQLIPKPKNENNAKKSKKKQKDAAPPTENGADAFSFPMPEISKFILTLGDDVWMDYRGLLIQSNGSLMLLRKPEQSVRIFGELAFTKGTLNIPFFSNTFKVNQGTAYFNGGDPVIDKKTGEITDYAMNPVLEMNAETLASGTEIFMGYSGSMEDLQAAMKPGSGIRADLNIYSIPALSKDDIMRLLLGGTVIGSITETVNGENATGGQQLEGAAISALSSFFLTPITRTFGRAFSLSDISLQYSPVGAVTLRISKALDRDERFFITYSQFKPPQGDSLDIWGLEYKYRPGMRLRVEDYQDAFTYSLQGRVEFDTFSEFWRELFKSANFFNTKKK